MQNKVKVLWSAYGIYFVLAFLLVFLVGIAYLPIWNAEFRNLFIIPISSVVTAFLVPLFLNEIKHFRQRQQLEIEHTFAIQQAQIDRMFQSQQKQIEQAFAAQENQIDRNFSLGVSTHMSNQIFDRQVVFCLEYVAKLQAAVLQMQLDGSPNAHALKDGQDLSEIRLRHILWLPQSLNAAVYPIEHAFKRMGALATNLDRDHSPDRLTQMAFRDESYDIFFNLLGWAPYRTREHDPNMVAEKIHDLLRDVLGIDDFLEFRVKALRAASGAVTDPLAGKKV